MTIELALGLLLFAVVVSSGVRDFYRRRLTRRLVTLLHARGYHAAAHEVRRTLLPGVFPSQEELDMEGDGRR